MTVTSPSAVPTAAPLQPLSVVGNQLVAGGKLVRLLGVNRSGSEYECLGSYGIFDGPSDQASVSAMLSWHVNAVRVPLNEQCWLGVSGISAQDSGPAYQNAIAGYVRLLESNGIYAILDLHTSSPLDKKADFDQIPMADANHAIPFWRSVATLFKNDPGVAYDLYNEPFNISWSCWQLGCYLKHPKDYRGDTLASYEAAGMQQMDDAVRGTGATQPVILGGLGYAHDLSQWLAHEPTDPTGNVAASLHLYPNQSCTASSCSRGNAVCAPADCAGGKGVLPKVDARVPVVADEIGEYDCKDDLTQPLYSYFDQHGISFLGWAWDAGSTWQCGSGPALIDSYDGSPTDFGIGLRNALLAE